jgi:hypothetical protein
MTIGSPPATLVGSRARDRHRLWRGGEDAAGGRCLPEDHASIWTPLTLVVLRAHPVGVDQRPVQHDATPSPARSPAAAPHGGQRHG